jgi:DNA polymerase III epsilon subunit-like protein
MNRRVLVVDTETTGLDFDSHELWEFAAIEWAPDSRAEHVWHVQPDLDRADPAALDLNRYKERTAGLSHWTGVHDAAAGSYWSDPEVLAGLLGRFLDNVTIVGATPGFDERFTSKLLRAHGQPPMPWHYRVRDIGSITWGWLNGAHALYVPPLDASTDEFARTLEIDPDRYERHAGLPDCRMAADMLQVMFTWAANGPQVSPAAGPFGVDPLADPLAIPGRPADSSAGETAVLP